ncbi:hypothetical protein H9P43_009899 [Blastocladiella emersonii ATCC 22665]|nr:hypothetical protein H9P43_009899 [Blastocladiella emersonii ATCC 22665]
MSSLQHPQPKPSTHSYTGLSPLASPTSMSDVDRLHLQMMALHEQMGDYDMDSDLDDYASTMGVPTSSGPVPTTKHTPSPAPRGGLPQLPPSPRGGLPPSGPPPTSRTPSAPPMTAPAHPELDAELADDDIDALYHSIRQQKIASVIIETPLSLALSQGQAPPLPTPPATAELVVLRKDNVALRDSVAEYKRKVGELTRDVEDGHRRTRALEEQLRHFEMLFEQAHQDNEAKYERIADLETDVDQLRSDVRSRDAELARAQTQLLDTQETVLDREDEIARLHRDLERFVDLEQDLRRANARVEALEGENDLLKAQVAKATADARQGQLEENLAQRTLSPSNIELPASPAASSGTPANDAIDTSAPPPPSQIKALNKAFADQLAKEREQFTMQLIDAERTARDADAHRKRLEDELASLRAKADDLEKAAKAVRRRSDYRARGSTNDLEIELDAYKVHVHHLKKLLQTHVGAGNSREFSETVTNLSLKLSYWTVLRDVYEETIQELVQIAHLDDGDDDA